MFDRLLVPTDGSALSEEAVEYAVSLARAHDATIRTVYVVNAANYGSLPMETAWDGIGEALREEGENAVERVREVVDGRVPVETVVREGSPSRAIVDEAQAGECDLIVMGTHGRGGIDRLLLGSVTERVVRRSSVPVLTLRLGAENVLAGAEESGPETTTKEHHEELS